MLSLLIGAYWRIRGLRVEASDTDSARGNGPEVVGPAESLIMAMAARAHSVPELSGSGLAKLTRRRRLAGRSTTRARSIRLAAHLLDRLSSETSTAREGSHLLMTLDRAPIVDEQVEPSLTEPCCEPLALFIRRGPEAEGRIVLLGL